jgi:hypothetical protein
VIIALVVVALTLPAELVLLQALSNPDPRLAISSWVGGLDAAELDSAASRVQSFPLAYRRALLKALNSDGKSRVVRGHIQSYIDDHPGLDSTALVLLEAAKAFATPDVFDRPTAADRAAAQVIGEQAVTLLGREDAEYLFARFGPRDGRFPSIEPVSMRLTNWVRGLFVAMADAADCDCNIEFGCELNEYCKSGTGCAVDSDWPACGWFWMQDCDGLCRIVVPGGG